MHEVNMQKLLLVLTMSLSYLATSDVVAIETSPSNANASSYVDNIQEQKVKVFEVGKLEQLLAPIALYPDALLSHVLIAATYPLEVVAAYRLKEANSALTHDELTDLASKKEWDPSVIALMPFEQVLKKLHDDLQWTQTLGEAFLSDEKQVLASIQTLRSQAEKAGNLTAMDNVEVRVEQQKIIIEPAQKEVIYVPYYDTRVVYGHWPWKHYPPVYWHVNHHYSHHRPYYWRSGIFITTGFYFSAFHWHNHFISVDYAYHKRYRKHYGHYGHHYYAGKRYHVVKSGYTKRWQHNPYHRKGANYRYYKPKAKHYAGYSKKPSHYSLNKKRVIKPHKYNKKVAHSHYKKANKASHNTIKNKLHQQRNKARKVSPYEMNKMKKTQGRVASTAQRAGNKNYQKYDKSRPVASSHKQFNRGEKKVNKSVNMARVNKSYSAPTYSKQVTNKRFSTQKKFSQQKQYKAKSYQSKRHANKAKSYSANRKSSSKMSRRNNHSKHQQRK